MTASVETLWDQVLKCLNMAKEYSDKAQECSDKAEEFLAERDQVRIDILPEIIFHQDYFQEIFDEIHKNEWLANQLALDFRRLHKESQEIYHLDKKKANMLADIGRKRQYRCQHVNDKIKLLYFEVSQLNVSWSQLLAESDLWHKLAISKIREAVDLRNQTKQLRSQAEELKLVAFE